LACTFNARDGKNLIGNNSDISYACKAYNWEQFNPSTSYNRDITNLACGLDTCDRDIDDNRNCNRTNFAGSLDACDNQNLIGDNEDRTQLSVGFNPRRKCDRFCYNRNIAKFASSFDPRDIDRRIRSNSNIANEAGSFDSCDFSRSGDEDLNVAKLRCALHPIWEYVCLGYNKDITKLTGGTYPSYGYKSVTVRSSKRRGSKWGKAKHSLVFLT
jgi:hypothetical protein